MSVSMVLGAGKRLYGYFSMRLQLDAVQAFFRFLNVPPKITADIGIATRVYQKMGMGPEIASTSCTHLELGKCPHNFRTVCTGISGKPTLSYSLSCSHQRKIYHVSEGFAGSKNVKDISKQDSFIIAVGAESIYRNFKWTLDVTDTTTEKRTGVFFIRDESYHKWGHMICGLKVSFIVLFFGQSHIIVQHTSEHFHTLWSLHMESVRKDVECTFGILKCRFRILSHPVLCVSNPRPPTK
jgi:hypothetical protein